MTPEQQFPTYPVEQLQAIYVNGVSPESMNYPYDCKHVKHKQLKNMMVNDNQVTIISTRLKNPSIRLRANQEVDIENPYSFEKRGICCGHFDYYLQRGGFMMRGYLVQFI